MYIRMDKMQSLVHVIAKLLMFGLTHHPQQECILCIIKIIKFEIFLDGKSGDLVSDGSEEKVINNRIKYEDNKERVVDLEIDERTVFVGNLPATTQKKQIKKLFAEVGRPETVRFRCAARPDMKTTKKVAVITKNFHEESSNICAYVKMKSPEEAKAACRLAVFLLKL